MCPMKEGSYSQRIDFGDFTKGANAGNELSKLRRFRGNLIQKKNRNHTGREYTRHVLE